QKILSSKLAQKRLPTSRKCQVMLTKSDSIKFKIQLRNGHQEEKADQETNIKSIDSRSWREWPQPPR
ncbi:MAG: hypothetical protein ACK55I_09325, partial [bacterium]